MQLTAAQGHLLRRIVMEGPLRLAGRDLESARALDALGLVRSVAPRSSGGTPFYVASGAGHLAERELAGALRPPSCKRSFRVAGQGVSALSASSASEIVSVTAPASSSPVAAQGQQL